LSSAGRIVLTPGASVNTECYTAAVSTRTTARPAVPRRSGAPAASPLQQRKRQLVRQEIAHAAWLLFADRGYEEATVEAIAEAAGVSRRTFFRYFSSKEDVVVGTTDALAEDVLAGFACRPKGELPLVAIQRSIRPAIETRLRDADESRAIVSLLRESRTLRRAMLERHARLEERLAVLIAERTGADPRRDPTPALLAFLARALMDTAFNVWFDQQPRDVGAMIDDLFRRLRAVVSERPRGAARRRKA
jgi:AcrR family transcriptional regulator